MNNLDEKKVPLPQVAPADRAFQISSLQILGSAASRGPTAEAVSSMPGAADLAASATW